MLYTLTLFIALFVATLTLMLGSGLLGSLLSLRMSAEGYAEQMIGVIRRRGEGVRLDKWGIECWASKRCIDKCAFACKATERVKS